MLLRMAAELNDTALMLRYQEGDVTAFETLYSRHRGPLFRFLLRQIGNQQFAEDVFQEVWSRIIRNSNNYRPTAKFTTYIYLIARNCAVDHHRRTGRQPDTVPAEGIAEPVAKTGDPIEAVCNSDVGNALCVALSELPTEQREAFLLREESGMSLDEIATVTGVGRETVKSRLRYALGKLRQCLPQPEGAGVEDG
jgi:RNA polymerase sigma-70 factor (ECF subfamily)